MLWLHHVLSLKIKKLVRKNLFVAKEKVKITVKNPFGWRIFPPLAGILQTTNLLQGEGSKMMKKHLRKLTVFVAR